MAKGVKEEDGMGKEAATATAALEARAAVPVVGYDPLGARRHNFQERRRRRSLLQTSLSFSWL